MYPSGPLLLSAPLSCRTTRKNTIKKAARRSVRGGSLRLGSVRASFLGVSGCERRTDSATCYFPIADYKRTNKDMSAKTVHRAAKASRKKALSPSSCGRLTGGRDTERTTAASQPVSQSINSQLRWISTAGISTYTGRLKHVIPPDVTVLHID